MKKQISLCNSLPFIRKIDTRLVSYNIEMTEITGGTFWKEYTKEQIEGKTDFIFDYTDNINITQTEKLMQYYPPINLYDEKLRNLANKLGNAWIRISGTWATKTYYDFDDSTNGKVPKGYQSILTRDEWIGVLEFVKHINGKLLISLSNCEGDHPNGGSIDLKQAKKIFEFSHNYGVDIDAIEFMNEPNILTMSGAPIGYTVSDYARDADIINSWVRRNYPNCLIVGPCTIDGVGDNLFERSIDSLDEKFIKNLGLYSTDDLMKESLVPLDVFSYHYYNCVSERIASLMPSANFDASEALSEKYLTIASNNAKKMTKYRDKYVPYGQMWVTESGDACGGGNTWASTYLDVFRTLNELGSFATISDGIIFHNTLASSDYGFLKHGSFETRPNYFAALLWNKLMGNEVYDCKNLNTQDLYVYAHSRKDCKLGYAYLIINASKSESVIINSFTNYKSYILSADNLRADKMKLNDEILEFNIFDTILERSKEKSKDLSINLSPCSCAFILI